LTTLLAIWQLSLLLCAIALFALALILIARVFADRRDGRRAAERRRVSRALMGMADEVPRPPQRGLERQEAARLALELAELVRGPDRAALLANAEQLRIPRVLWERSISRTPQERLLAVEALAMFPSGRERAREMLRDRNPNVRLGAALALAQNEAAPPAGTLVRQLGLGTTERSLLIGSLMRDLVEHDPSSVEDLLGDEEAGDAIKLAAVDALAASGRAEHAPLVAEMAEDAAEDSELLPRIFHALGRIGHPSGHAAILRGLSHPAWPVRAAAAQAAGRCALAEAVELLGDLLRDETWWVRFRAGEALWRLGPRGHAMLGRIAAGDDELASRAARLTLEERRDA
jgi:HEAT repeat protein